MPSRSPQTEPRRRRAVFRDLGFWFILAGYLVRVLLMPLTGQHDVMFMPWMAHFINLGHPNLYAYLHERFGEIVMRSPGVWAPYPYGFYAWTAGWLELGAGLGWWDLAGWDAAWAIPQEEADGADRTGQSALSSPARSVFLLKAAYLPFELLLATLLYRRGGRRALALWAWAPSAIYAPFLMGQNDLYATALAVAGTYAAARAAGGSRNQVFAKNLVSPPGRGEGPLPRPLKRLLRTGRGEGLPWAIAAALLLGVGATFKIYPLLLLPPLALIAARRWPQRLALIGLGGAVFGLAALPFLGTPAYVDGVLLNPEGTRLLRTVDLLGVPVSPFLVGYLILLFLLAWGRRGPNEKPGFWRKPGFCGPSEDAPSSTGTDGLEAPLHGAQRRSRRLIAGRTGRAGQHPHRRVGRADAPWLAALAVLGLLFLWTPTPFYWWIWLTPFLIAAAASRPRNQVFAENLVSAWIGASWLALEGAFVMTMLAAHRELGIALPVHLFAGFNLPNLPVSLAVAYPPLARLLTAAWPLVNAALVAGWLLALWAAFRGLARPCARSFEPRNQVSGKNLVSVPLWAALPLLGMCLGLAANLLAGWNLSGPPNWYAWQEGTLSPAGIVQALPAARVPARVSGVRLRLSGGDLGAAVRACLYGREPPGEPLACATAPLSRQVEEQVLYLMFDQPLAFGPDAPPPERWLRVDVPSGHQVTLPYTEAAGQGQVRLPGATIGGTLDVTLLAPFPARAAFQRLIVDNVLRDPGLIAALAAAAALVTAWLGLLLARSIRDTDLHR